jgi:putative lipoprotein
MLLLDKRLIYLIFGWVLLASAACTSQSGSLPNTGDGQTPEVQRNLANTKWKLVSFGKPGAETPVVESSTITLEFKAEGQAGGSGGCNSYGAHYEVQGNRLSFGEITSTLMACEQEGLGQQEQRYFQALETTSRFELTGDRLTVWYGDAQGVLNFVKG